MASWCLPRNLSSAFLDAIRDGTLTPSRLMEMTSAERRAEFAKIIGPENAAEVNAQFESKMLLKDQQRGFVSWAEKVAGISEATRRDLLAKIGRLDKVLQPGDEKFFLADLAATKLGVSVTAQEAREIYELSQKASDLRAVRDAAPGDNEAITNYGVANQRLIDKVNSLMPDGRTFLDHALNLLSLPQTALTSVFHWSALFVQGWGVISVKEGWLGAGKMFQVFGDPEAYERLNGWIVGHPDYALAVDGKLGLTKLTDKLTTREEAIQSSLIQDASAYLSEKTGVFDLIAGWSRSFTGYLNYVRASRFYNLVAAARLVGEDMSVGSRYVSDIANAVNNFTGRGNLGEGDRYANVGPILNTLFFAPRKIVATVEMFNPVRMLDPRISATARQAHARQLFGSLAATGAVLTLAKIAGAQVNFDPRAQDFGKIRLGNETLDMTGGNAAYTRLLARIITNQEITRTGKMIELGGSGPGAPSRASQVAQYLRGKLAPIAGTIWSASDGKDPVGRPFSMSNAVAEEMTPIVIHSLLEVWNNSPRDAVHLLPAISAFLGVAVESPDPPMSPNGRSVWGDKVPPFSPRQSYFDDPVNQEAERLGLRLNFPPPTIRGQKLSDEQYDDYVRQSGVLAHSRLDQIIASPTWGQYPPAARLSVMKDVIKTSREIAANSIMLQSQGGPNDILKAAKDAKLAAMAAQPAAP